MNNKWQEEIEVLRNLLVQTTRAYEEQLTAAHHEKEFLEITLRSIGEGVLTTDASGYIQYINPAGEKITGWALQELRGKLLWLKLEEHSSKDSSRLYRIAQDAWTDSVKSVLSENIIIKRKDGKSITVQCLASALRDRLSHIIGLVLLFQDVSEQQLLQLQLAHHATHDSLTGLPNRKVFHRFLEESLASSGQNKAPDILCYMDLDEFKLVNDTSGHIAGDALLCQVTSLLVDNIRPKDTAARLGGDEFAILLSQCPLERALQITRTLHRMIYDTDFTWHEKVFKISASIGLVPITSDFQTVTEILSAADHACYLAKQKGRNRIQVYSPRDYEISRRHGEMEWVLQLRNNLKQGLFELYAQPILPVQHKIEKRHNFEVLLRMRGDNNVRHLPGNVIQAAERYNLMQNIDRWVLQQAFAILRELPEKTRASMDFCSLNLSRLSLMDESFLDYILNLTETYSIDPNKICFEITESAVMSDLHDALLLIHTLENKGFRFALDDFGSGMSSCAYLRDIPVHFIKIDGSFVRGCPTDRLDRTIIESIHRIARLQGIQTIAESVNSRAVFNVIREMDIDYVQGNWIGQPRPFFEWIYAAGTGECLPLER